MKSLSIVLCAVAMLGTGCAGAQRNSGDKSETVATADTNATATPKVYMLKEINADNLVKIYEALGREAKGKVAVKISTGEPGGHNFLDPALIKPLVQKVNGPIVGCKSSDPGKRCRNEEHR